MFNSFIFFIGVIIEAWTISIVMAISFITNVALFFPASSWFFKNVTKVSSKRLIAMEAKVKSITNRQNITLLDHLLSTKPSNLNLKITWWFKDFALHLSSLPLSLPLLLFYWFAFMDLAKHRLVRGLRGFFLNRGKWFDFRAEFVACVWAYRSLSSDPEEDLDITERVPLNEALSFFSDFLFYTFIYYLSYFVIGMFVFNWQTVIVDQPYFFRHCEGPYFSLLYDVPAVNTPLHVVEFVFYESVTLAAYLKTHWYISAHLWRVKKSKMSFGWIRYKAQIRRPRPLRDFIFYTCFIAEEAYSTYYYNKWQLGPALNLGMDWLTTSLNMVLNVHLTDKYIKFFQQSLLLDYLLKEALQKVLTSVANVSIFIALEKAAFNWFSTLSLGGVSLKYYLNFSVLEDWFLPIVAFFNFVLVALPHHFNPALLLEQIHF